MVKLAQNSIRSTELSIAYSPCYSIVLMCYNNILRFGLNNISAGTVDYTGGEEVRANLLKGRSFAKPEAHESLAHG
jgi:hypothetical protein